MHRPKRYATKLLAAAAIAVSGTSHAASVGFTLVISEGGTNPFNAPRFELTNESDLATLNYFTFTIGDESKNFDHVQNVTPASELANVDNPDEVDDSVRANLLQIDFAGIAAGNTVSWVSDVDDDNASNGNSVEDAREVFFNNGGLANSVATAMFSDDRSVVLTLPDGVSDASSYTYTAMVPLPAAAWLFGSALFGLGWLQRRQRRAGNNGSPLAFGGLTSRVR